MTKPTRKGLTGWVISDGRRGIENQALGLAESLARQHDFEFTSHVINNKGAFAAFGPRLQSWLRRSLKAYGLGGAPLPDIMIGCGRQAIAPLLTAKTKHPDIFTVYIQNPRLPSSRFDAVIAPEHDDYNGHNVFTIIGSPNRITKEVLHQAGHDMPLAAAHSLNAFAPLAGWLVGGPSKNFHLDGKALSQQIDLAGKVLDQGYDIYITTSRRTPEIARSAYRDFADQNDRVRFYAGQGDNPYLALLDQANVIFVTQDSTNMITESCTAGKSVYLLPMSGRPGKFQKLYGALATRCYVQPFTGETIKRKAYPPLRETDRAAKALWARFQGARFQGARGPGN